jgi:aspartyl-tRNA(Asn)/glutamyl-tRNA(Gln) amidotransferase subunit B
LEIVTEPDLRSSAEAAVFLRELRLLLTYIAVSDCNMQEGSLRVDANINLHIDSPQGKIATPIVEVKNMNSFRAVERALDYEAPRQYREWQEAGRVLGQSPKQTRGWDDAAGVTRAQRSKEESSDYRYFPDPDLVPVELSAAMREEIRASLPELPIARRMRLERDGGLSSKDAETIVGHRATADLFEAVIAAGGPAEVVGKQFVNVWLKLANDRGAAITDLDVDAKRMASLAQMTAAGTVSSTAANQLAEQLVSRPESPAALAKELGLLQVQDTDATASWVAEAFQANEPAVRDALGNPKKAKAAAGFLRGQVMRISGGKADPKLVGQLIEQRIAELGNQG